MEVELAPDGAGGYDATVRGGLRQQPARDAAYARLRQMFVTEPQRHRAFLRAVDTDRDGEMSAAELDASVIAFLVTADIQLFDGDRYAPRFRDAQPDSVSLAIGLHLAACPEGRCTAAAPPNLCRDRIVDGDETDVDCGGSCGATCKDTGPQQTCKVAGDCVSGVCSGNPLVCQPPTCTDTVKNGSETGPDCGGAQCVGLGKTCGVGVACGANADCTSNPHCTGASFTGASVCNAVCVAGAVTDCSATAKVCDAVLGCVACNAPSDCPATGNECVVNTCSNHACGTSFLGASHTLSTGQTPGDCQTLVCNGAGGTTSVDDGADLPVSATVCATNPACAGSPLAPTFAFAATGTSCAADGQFPKTVCGDTADVTVAGKCVECNTNGDCSAVNDAGSLSCVGHVCQ
jgi:hypothetical protein